MFNGNKCLFPNKSQINCRGIYLQVLAGWITSPEAAPGATIADQGRDKNNTPYLSGIFQSTNFKASSPLSRCEKPATKNQLSVAAFFCHLHKLNLVLFQHLFSVQVQLTGSRHSNLMLSALSIFCHLAFFLRREMGFIFQHWFLVLLWEYFRTRYISKYLSSLRFLVLSATDRQSKWIKLETQDTD